MEKEPSEPKNDGHFLDEDVDRCSNDLSFERRLKSPNWFIDFPGVISIHFRLMHQPFHISRKRMGSKMTGNRVTDPARRQKSSKSPAQHRSLSN
jgi:hypothetical protein